MNFFLYRYFRVFCTSLLANSSYSFVQILQLKISEKFMTIYSPFFLDIKVLERKSLDRLEMGNGNSLIVQAASSSGNRGHDLKIVGDPPPTFSAIKILFKRRIYFFGRNAFILQTTETAPFLKQS